MRSVNDIAGSFSITGLLDESSKTRNRFPVVEIGVADIADHPANVAYSMDPESIRKLADSIAKDGLTDLPLVRKMDDGSWQMLSGHRRKAAYSLLSESDASFARIPCRVIEGVSDSQAVTLLHTANYFVRSLTVTERAAATAALGVEVERMRETDPDLSGVRTEDIKAAIVSQQTGRKVSGKTIQREERMAKAIREELSPEWAEEADCGKLAESSVAMLRRMPKQEQSRLHKERPEGMGKRDVTAYLKRAADSQDEVDARLVKALEALRSYANSTAGPSDADAKAVVEIRRLATNISKRLKQPVH